MLVARLAQVPAGVAYAHGGRVINEPTCVLCVLDAEPVQERGARVVRHSGAVSPLFFLLYRNTPPWLRRGCAVLAAHGWHSAPVLFVFWNALECGASLNRSGVAVARDGARVGRRSLAHGGRELDV